MICDEEGYLQCDDYVFMEGQQVLDWLDKTCWCVQGSGGDTFGGGNICEFWQSLMDEDKDMEEEDVPRVEVVLDGAFGALGDEH